MSIEFEDDSGEMVDTRISDNDAMDRHETAETEPTTATYQTVHRPAEVDEERLARPAQTAPPKPPAIPTPRANADVPKPVAKPETAVTGETEAPAKIDTHTEVDRPSHADLPAKLGEQALDSERLTAAMHTPEQGREVRALVTPRATTEAGTKMGYPDTRKAEATVRSGEKVWFQVERTERGGPMKFTTHRANDARGSVSDEIKQDKAELTPQQVQQLKPGEDMPDGSGFHVRFLRVQHDNLPTAETKAGASQADRAEQTRLDLHALGERAADARFSYRAEVNPVAPAETKEVEDEGWAVWHNAGATAGANTAAAQVRYDRARATTDLAQVAGRETVTIGAPTFEELRTVVQEMSSVLPADAQSHFAPELTKTGQIRVYRDQAEAHAEPDIRVNSTDSIVRVADSVHRTVDYSPTRPLEGLPHLKHHEFDVNQNLPVGARTISFANLLKNEYDGDGRLKEGEPLKLNLDAIGAGGIIVAESGMIKTTIIKAMTDELQKQGIAVTILTCAKNGDFDSFGIERAGKGYNPKDMPVHIITAGGDKEVNAIVDPLSPSGDTPRGTQVDNFLRLLLTDKMDPDTYRALSKFIQAAVEQQLIDLGISTETGESRYPIKEHLEASVRGTGRVMIRAINQLPYAPKEKTNLGGFSSSSHDTATMRPGVRGSLVNGNRLRLKSFSERGRTVVYQMGNIANESTQTLLAGTIARGIYDNLKSVLPPGGNAPLRHVVFVDESKVFDGESGKDMAALIKIGRHVGLAIVPVRQDNVNEWHPDVMGNATGFRIVGRVGLSSDREELAKNTNMRDGNEEWWTMANRGEFTIYTPDTKDGSLRGRTINPAIYRAIAEASGLDGKDFLQDGRELVEPGLDAEDYTGAHKSEAMAIALDKASPVGDLVRGWVEDTVIAALDGFERELPSIGNLAIPLGALAPKVAASLITTYVEEAARTRPAINHRMLRMEFGAEIRDYMLAELHNTPRPEWPFGTLAMNYGYWNSLGAAIEQTQLAGRIKDEKYLNTLGPLPGRTSEEQQAYVERIRDDSRDTVVRAIHDVTQRLGPKQDVTLAPKMLDTITAAAKEYARLSGGTDDDAIAATNTYIKGFFKQDIDNVHTREAEILKIIAEASKDYVEDGISYDTALEEITQAMAEASANTNGVLKKDFEDRYGATALADFPEGPGSINLQRDWVVTATENFIAESGYTVTEKERANLYNPPDHLDPTADFVTWSIIGGHLSRNERIPGGEAMKAERDAHNGGTPVQLTYGELLRHNDPRAGYWNEAASILVYGPAYKPLGLQRYLKNIRDAQTGAVFNTHQEFKDKGKS